MPTLDRTHSSLVSGSTMSFGGSRSLGACLATAFVVGAADGLAAQGRAGPLVLVEEFRLPADPDGTAPGLLLPGPDGVLAVTYGRAGPIRLLDRTGKRLASVGRKGEGPGEFEAISSTRWSGDTLTVLDGALRRISQFSAAGKLLRTTPLPPTPTMPTGRALAAMPMVALLPGDELLYRASRRDTVDVGKWEMWLFVGDRAGRLRRVLGQVVRDECVIDAGNRSGAVPYCARVHVAISPSGEFSASLRTVAEGDRAATLHATVYRSSGGVPTRWQVRGPAQPLARADWDASMAELDAWHREMIRGRPMPAIRPPIVTLRVGDDGSLWLRTEQRDEDAPVEWKGYHATGAPIGTIVLSFESRILNASNGTVTVREVSRDGEEAVVRYRIAR